MTLDEITKRLEGRIKTMRECHPVRWHVFQAEEMLVALHEDVLALLRSLHSIGESSET